MKGLADTGAATGLDKAFPSLRVGGEIRTPTASYHSGKGLLLTHIIQLGLEAVFPEVYAWVGE